MSTENINIVGISSNKLSIATFAEGLKDIKGFENLFISNITLSKLNYKFNLESNLLEEVEDEDIEEECEESVEEQDENQDLKNNILLVKDEYDVYKAVKGDNLSYISMDRYGTEKYVDEILELNSIVRPSI